MPRFITKKWIEVHYQCGSAENRHNPNKQIRFKIPILRSDLCDYNDPYIVAKGNVTVEGAENRDKHNRVLVLKNNAPFLSCISKINNTLIDNAEDLDIAMPMYNLLEYSKNYSKTSGSLWNYYKDISTDPITNSESFKYKTSITGKIANNGNTKDVEFSVPLKYLSNFWRTINMPLINCKVNHILTWSKNCGDAGPNADPPVEAINAPASSAFAITDCKLYVPVVTLSAENDNNLLDQLKTGFNITIKWNKYRSEMSNQTKNNNLNYLIDPTFTKMNRLFVLSFENENDRTSFSKYYVPKIEIKDFNVLIDGKTFFEIPVKNKEEAYEANIEMSRNDDYTTGNYLDYEYFSKHYRLIAIDLSKKMELETDLKQQINFIGRLERNEGATIFFIIEEREETAFDFSQHSVAVV